MRELLEFKNMSLIKNYWNLIRQDQFAIELFIFAFNMLARKDKTLSFHHLATN